MHVLLTRPEGDAAELKASIEAIGLRVSLAPLLEIRLHPIDADALTGATAIVATSRNGLRAIAQSEAIGSARALPVFAVGPGTGQLAKDLGFETVIAGPGTALELIPIIAAHPGIQKDRLVHLAGDHLAFDLSGALSQQGITLSAIPAYASVAAETLPDDTILALAAGSIDTVVLMSPRSAATWARLTNTLPIKQRLTDITYICLSRAVADALSGTGGLKTVIADRPHADAIVSAVYRLAASAKTG